METALTPYGPDDSHAQVLRMRNLLKTRTPVPLLYLHMNYVRLWRSARAVHCSNVARACGGELEGATTCSSSSKLQDVYDASEPDVWSRRLVFSLGYEMV